MKKPKNFKGIKIRPTQQTQIAIYRLMLDDYKQQLEDLKHNKQTYEHYEHYRYCYIRLHGSIADITHRLKNLED